MISFNTKTMRMGLIGVLLGLVGCNSSITSRIPSAFNGKIDNEKIELTKSFADGVRLNVDEIEKVPRDFFSNGEKVLWKGYPLGYSFIYYDYDRDGKVDYVSRLYYYGEPIEETRAEGTGNEGISTMLSMGEQISSEEQDKYNNYLEKIIERSKNK